jgi:hypothetical protein
MNHTLFAAALFAALGSFGLAHAQMNAAPPPANPAAAEPTTNKSPDPTLPYQAPGTASDATTNNNSRAGCATGTPGSGSAQFTSPSMSAPLPNGTAPCR